MTSGMTLIMTSKAQLFTDEDLDVERVFEVKILDSRKRKGITQKSFSIYTKKETKDTDYPATEEMRDFLQKMAKKIQEN